MSEMLDSFLADVQQLRALFRETKVDDYVVELMSDYVDGKINHLDFDAKLSYAIIADYPQINIYKVQADMPVTPSPWRDSLTYGKFCAPWIFYISLPDGKVLVISHVFYGGFHVFVELKLKSSDRRYYEYSSYSYREENDTWGNSSGKMDYSNAQWIMEVFNMMHDRKYIDVLVQGSHKHRKARRLSKSTVTTLRLNEAGKRYHAQQKKPTANIHWKDGKEKMPIEVRSFSRKQHFGKGRTEVKLVEVSSFKRRQWVVPKDKITKIV